MYQKALIYGAVSAGIIVATSVGTHLYSRRLEKKIAKMRAQLAIDECEMAVINNRMMAIANQLDTQLDTAKFWEIVTRP